MPKLLPAFLVKKERKKAKSDDEEIPLCAWGFGEFCAFVANGYIL